MGKYSNPEDLQHPVVNVEETIGKTVGRRLPPSPLQIQPGEVENAKAWQHSFGGLRVRPGVYRFTSFEDADAWMMKHQIQAGS
ncbi:MAG: hypothetical protein QOD99_2104 [Chthoniobacter sp.]|jgi:hypothetical protein|nr:hypothetical protein [Chthoniobacter sp.]